MAGRTGWDLVVYSVSAALDLALVVVAGPQVRDRWRGGRAGDHDRGSNWLRLALVRRFVGIFPWDRTYARLVVPAAVCAIAMVGVHVAVPTCSGTSSSCGGGARGYRLRAGAAGVRPRARREGGAPQRSRQASRPLIARAQPEESGSPTPPGRWRHPPVSPGTTTSPGVRSSSPRARPRAGSPRFGARRHARTATFRAASPASRSADSAQRPSSSAAIRRSSRRPRAYATAITMASAAVADTPHRSRYRRSRRARPGRSRTHQLARPRPRALDHQLERPGPTRRSRAR